MSDNENLMLTLRRDEVETLRMALETAAEHLQDERMPDNERWVDAIIELERRLDLLLA